MKQQMKIEDVIERLARIPDRNWINAGQYLSTDEHSALKNHLCSSDTGERPEHVLAWAKEKAIAYLLSSRSKEPISEMTTISDELDRLDEAVSEAGMALEDVAHRLEPAMRSAPGKSQSTPEGNEVPPTSTIKARIQSARARVDAIFNMACHMSRNLDL